MEPLLSPEFLDWIKKGNFSKSTILEIGSGESTLFFSNYFKYVHSFEDDPEWLDKTKKNIELVDNVEINKFDNTIFNNEDFIYKISNSDVILIDNNPKNIGRHEFAYFVHHHKKKGSIIILDNGDWNIDAYEFLRSKYYCLDFLRKDKREDNQLTQTSVFFHLRTTII